MAQVADILLLFSVILFFTGILVGFIGPLRKALPLINKKLRLRHFFAGSLLIFMVSLVLGWQSFKAGLMEGYCDNINSPETIEICREFEKNSD